MVTVESTTPVNCEVERRRTICNREHCRITNWLRWRPTSTYLLEMSERNILSHIWEQTTCKFVAIENGTRHIRTISLNTESPNTPLVLLHGMGSGVGLWALNLQALAKNRPVYAIDLVGFGRSSRINFPKDAVLAEAVFVESIESWRREMGLNEHFALLGHSMGGYIAAAYALRYAQNIKHLILADPWGFMEAPSNEEWRGNHPVWLRAIATLLQPFNPLTGVRAAGPWGPNLVRLMRPDMERRFSHLFTDNTVCQYIYHCNAQTPSGETAFSNMSERFGWAKNPMIKRIVELEKTLPMTYMFGSRSWIDSSVAYEIKYLRNDSYVDIQVLKGAGHHVYADRATEFNSNVNKVLTTCDETEES